jgi:hypothetical protein
VKCSYLFARFPNLFLSGAVASFAICMPCKHSTIVTDGQGMGAESRELAAGCGRELGSGSGLGKDSDATEGQGAAEDATFRDSDRGHG